MSSISLSVGKLLRKMSVMKKVKQYVELAKSVTAAFQLFYSKEGYTSIDVNPEMIKA